MVQFRTSIEIFASAICMINYISKVAVNNIAIKIVFKTLSFETMKDSLQITKYIFN